MNEIDYNALLYYLSLRNKGSWNQFKHFVDNINYRDKKININSVRLMFSRLGHIEFSFDKESGNIWSIAYPCVNLIPNTKIGILSGYRTKAFLAKLKEYCSKKNIDYISEKNFEAPDCIKLDFNCESSIEDFKHKNDLNIEISTNLSSKILYLHQNIDNEIQNLELLEDFNNPDDYGLKKFDNITKYKFDENSTKENFKNGLYERKLYENREYYLLLDKKWYRIEKNTGKFIFFYLNNIKNLIKYENKSLKIIKYLHFPELIDRALTNFSGHNPKIIEGNRIYDNIDKDFANNLAIKIGQELEK